MAKRRSIDLSGFNQTLNQLMQHQLRLRELGQQNILLGERQANENAFSLIPQVGSGALQAENMSPDLLSRMGKYIDVNKFSSLGKDRAMGQIEGKIGEASNLGEVPTPNAMLGSMKAAGISTDPVLGAMRQDIPAGPSGLTEEGTLPSAQMGPVIPPRQKQLFETAQQKTNQLQNEENKKVTGVESIDPVSGQKVNKFIPTAQLGQQPPQITGLGAADLGRLQSEQTKAGPDFNPEIQSTLTRNAANRAGAVEGAQLRQQYAPWVIKAEIEKASAIADIQAQKTNDLALMKEARDTAAQATQAIQPLYHMRQVYNTIEDVGVAGQGARAAGRATGQLQRFNPAAAELDSMREGMATMIYAALGGKGNVSDADKASLLQILPSSTTLHTVGDKLFNDLETTLMLSPIAASHLQHMPIQQRLMTVKKWTQLLDQIPPTSQSTGVVDPETGVFLPRPGK